MVSGVKYEEITRRGLVVTTREGVRQTIEADTVVTAMPLVANTALTGSMKGSCPELYAVGDAREPNMIIDAIADGSRIGRVI